MSDKLKEIALELLDKYRSSEESCIYEFSGSIAYDLNHLEKEVEEYKEKITKENDNE